MCFERLGVRDMLGLLFVSLTHGGLKQVFSVDKGRKNQFDSVHRKKVLECVLGSIVWSGNDIFLAGGLYGSRMW